MQLQKNGYSIIGTPTEIVEILKMLDEKTTPQKTVTETTAIEPKIVIGKIIRRKRRVHYTPNGHKSWTPQDRLLVKDLASRHSSLFQNPTGVMEAAKLANQLGRSYGSVLNLLGHYRRGER